jgi:hypothetical protein
MPAWRRTGTVAVAPRLHSRWWTTVPAGHAGRLGRLDLESAGLSDEERELFGAIVVQKSDLPLFAPSGEIETSSRYQMVVKASEAGIAPTIPGQHPSPSRSR